MAIVGPFVPSDIEVIAIVDALRVQEDFVLKTATFTIGVREAAGFIITSAAAVTATLPDATSTDLKVGSKFYLINDGSSVGVTTVNFNTTGTLGTLAVGESALVVLKSKADANGTWELIQLDRDEGVIKYSANFNGDAMPTAGASWEAAASGAFRLNVLASVHGRGTLPVVDVYRGVSSGAQSEPLVRIDKAVNGDVDVVVTETPSGLFAGTIIIS